MVRAGEEFLGQQLSPAHHVHRIDSLVGADRHDLLHAVVDRRIHHVLCADHVGLYSLEGIELAERHMLHCRHMEDDIRFDRRPVQPLRVAHIPDETDEVRKPSEFLHQGVLHLLRAG